MAHGSIDIHEIHWLMDMLQSIDVGLVVVDRQYRVQLWNSFMENHSGRRPEGVIGKNLLELFPDIPADWFRRKAEAVFLLRNRAFTTWEQRPFLFRFDNYRPITGTAEHMYQDITFIPLSSAAGEVEQVGLIIYDVTDVATGRRALESANTQLETLSRTDRLTGLNNRGWWEECLAREFQRLKRTREAGSLLMFDIDHFKNVNDTYGHPGGDEVLRQLAAALRARVRATDIAGRYGGEEFGVILINSPILGAQSFAERLRLAAQGLRTVHDGKEIRFTISLGVAAHSEGFADHKAWIAAADQALYRAKEGGRNRTVVYKAA